MRRLTLALVLGLGAPALLAAQIASAPASGYVVNDSHFHLTNYVQQGTDIREFLKIMGDKVGRVALFGIPFDDRIARSVSLRRRHRISTGGERS